MVLHEYILNERVPGSMISYLENFGSVTVITDMAQPFYTFRMGDYFNVKGMVEDRMMFVRYQPDFMPDTEEFFTRLVQEFNPNAPDLKTVHGHHDRLLKTIKSSSRKND
jgi:hypothetical protein